LARTQLGRWGDPDDCGNVIAFLCSNRARFLWVASPSRSTAAICLVA